MTPVVMYASASQGVATIAYVGYSIMRCRLCMFDTW